MKLREIIKKRIMKKLLNEAIQIGKKYELGLDGYGAAMFGMTSSEFRQFKKYEGKPCVAIKLVEDDGQDAFYDIKFADGKVFEGISDWHLKPIGWSAGK